MPMQFICGHCPTILNESERRPHISAKHLSYFPFECASCKKANQNHLAATKEAMDQHISANHTGNNSGILLVEDKAKEVELNKMVEQCIRFSKRRLSNNISNDSVENPGKKILVDNDTHFLHETNHNNANSANQDTMDKNAATSPRNDHIEHQSPSAQITSSVPADSPQKETITKLFIVISEGIVCFETADRRKHEYAPLSKYLPILRKSALCENRCQVVIQFYACDPRIPFMYRKTIEQPKQEFSSLEQLESFAEEIQSIAYLWAKETVNVHFSRFKKKSNGSPSQLDYCTELFSRERTILKCKKLSIALVDNWALSIVTNVVDCCEECDLELEEVSPKNNELHDAFLKELYERDVLPRTAVTLFLSQDSALHDFIVKLKQKFRHAPKKRFKFELYYYSTKFQNLALQTQDGTLESNTLESKTTRKVNNLYAGIAVIEQRATDS